MAWKWLLTFNCIQPERASGLDLVPMHVSSHCSSARVVWQDYTKVLWVNFPLNCYSTDNGKIKPFSILLNI